MQVLLPGGAGYIGSHTCIALLEANYNVIVLDDFSNSSREALRRVEKITQKKIILYEGNCTDAATVNHVFAENRIDAVIHFAGYKAVAESVVKPLDYYQNNLDATMTLLKTMASFGVKRFIFSSSATVYGTNELMPLREDFPTGCTNPYGWSKWINERILTDVAAADLSWSVVMLRYFNPIGAHESGNIGEDPEGIPNNLMPYLCQVAAGRHKKLSIFGHDYPTPDKTGVRDYIHVMDLAEGHLAALKYSREHTGNQIFNLGTGEGYSVLQLVKTFEEANGIQVPYVFAPRRPGDIAVCFADVTKAKEMLHWQAKRDLKQMCRDAWNWQKSNPLGYREMPS
jgi:UDP-glucose 4-epimerase